MRILLVEDDLQLGAALHRSLEQEGYESTWVRRLKEARAFLDQSQLSLAVLDINLPDGEGFALLEHLRSGGAVLPVIIMSARDGLEDRLRGLNGGADDYITKPFAVAELMARIRVALRRAAGFASERWTFGDLTIDPSRASVRVGDDEVSLTPTEFKLLVELASRAGRVLDRATLIERIWGHSGEGSEAALEFQVHGLRRKVGPRRIRTVRGQGYRMEAACDPG